MFTDSVTGYDHESRGKITTSAKTSSRNFPIFLCITHYSVQNLTGKKEGPSWEEENDDFRVHRIIKHSYSIPIRGQYENGAE